MDKKTDDYVWYASYGSNINYDRFLLYITGGKKLFYGVEIENQGCEDKSLPLRDKPFQINHPIYFAKKLNRWGGGVAFLDSKREGLAKGRVYLITKEQFTSIKKQEGSWYQEEVDLGLIEGYPVKTFTGFHTDVCKPSVSYLNTINDGLKQIGCEPIKI